MEVEEVDVGEVVSDVFLVSEARLSTDKRGGKYYSLVLNCDNGDQVDAKVWSDNIADDLEAGSAIEVLARVDEFRGDKQLNIQRYDLIPEDDFDPSPYIRTTEINEEDAFDTLFNWEREEFQNRFLKRLLTKFYKTESFAKQFKCSPAAERHHHNYRGGLVEHTFEMWELSERLYNQYRDNVDRELLLAGTALHDIGKIKCYRLVSGVSQSTSHSDLLDHVFISASMVSNLWDKIMTEDFLGDEKDEAGRTKAMLLHMILSHHGKRDWGAAVLPKCPEAILLHFCDHISATMKTCFDAIENTPEGEDRTEWLSLMDANRQLVVSPDTI
ncbi:MAG: 3'-5' exoribonuclease YhaM family protein [Planctomycetota bacterium]